MFIINYFVANNGECPVWDYIKSLEERRDKNNRMKLKKINMYLHILSTEGTTAVANLS